jgi:hypothetical protein
MSQNVMTDFLSQLGTLADEPTTYWDNYETQSTPNLPLNPGYYVVTVPAIGENFKPGKTRPDKDGKEYFQYEMSPVVSFPEASAGKVLKFQRFSVKKSLYRSGSLAGDLIMATGIDAKPANAQGWLAAMPELAGQEFGVEVELQVYDSEAKKVVFDKSTAMLKNADGSFKTRYVYKNGALIQNADQEAEAVKLKNDGGPGAQGIKVLYANNRLIRILPAAEVRKLRAA